MAPEDKLVPCPYCGERIPQGAADYAYCRRELEGLRAKETQELISIWRDPDSEQWVEEDLLAIKRLLIQRGHLTTLFKMRMDAGDVLASFLALVIVAPFFPLFIGAILAGAELYSPAAEGIVPSLVNLLIALLPPLAVAVVGVLLWNFLAKSFLAYRISSRLKNEAIPISRKAKWSFRLAIAGVTLLPLLGSVLGVILGILALREIDQSEGRLRGRAKAIVSLILGVAPLAWCGSIPLIRGLFTLAVGRSTVCTLLPC